MDEFNNEVANPYKDPIDRVETIVEPVKETKKEKRAKKSGGFAKKLFGAIAIGLVFGLTAGAGFYGFNVATGTTPFWEKQEGINAETQALIDELQAQIDGMSTSTSVISTAKYDGTTYVTTDVTSVVDAVMPSMVSVTNVYEETVSYWGRRYTQENQASGSGIIIGENDNEYLIVTNFHVVDKTVQLTVTFVDETQAEAYVKGYDSSVDIAVIAVSKDNLKAPTKREIKIASMGNSETLRIGEPAIAIGNALGYGQSVTTGVISALNRDIEMENTCSKLIQTSAAINPGNSGGALLNIKGEVIGINSNKIGGTTVESMGYAIPISEVKDIIENLSNRETREKVDEASRGFLGISGTTVDETLQAYGFPEGIYVKKVYERSSAEAAGIIVGDIITKIDGQTVTEISQLQDMISYYGGGDTVDITLMRAGVNGYQEMTITVTLSTKSILDEQ